MRILFLARSMLRGGCERQLAVLAGALRQRGHEVAVALFYQQGELLADLQRQNVPVFDLGKKGRWDLPGFVWRLLRTIRDFAPDVVHGYLPVPNCLALLAARLSGSRARVVFGVRASEVRQAHYDRLSMLSYWLEERLSPWADLTIANSHAGRERAIRAGFPAKRTMVVANGIDTDRFRPDPAHRQALRQRLAVGEGEKLVGMVGRLDPMKDHPTFLAAAARLAAQQPGLHFVCVGEGPESYRQQLAEQATRAGLAGRLHWLPACQQVEQIYPGLDVLVSASAFGEGFSNVLAEAMACGVPCVATNVGDSLLIIDQPRQVVPPADPAALAAAVQVVLDAPPDRAGLRSRIVEHFSITGLVEQTECILMGLCVR